MRSASPTGSAADASIAALSVRARPLHGGCRAPEAGASGHPKTHERVTLEVENDLRCVQPGALGRIDHEDHLVTFHRNRRMVGENAAVHANRELAVPDQRDLVREPEAPLEAVLGSALNDPERTDLGVQGLPNLLVETDDLSAGGRRDEGRGQRDQGNHQETHQTFRSHEATPSLPVLGRVTWGKEHRT